MAAYVQGLYLARISTVASLAGPSMEPSPLRLASALHGSLVNDSSFALGKYPPFGALLDFLCIQMPAMVTRPACGNVIDVTEKALSPPFFERHSSVAPTPLVFSE